ncbi:IS3 family transposase [Neorhizobium petrolearium]|uniref:IS3 family transposase n=1 Tax=Neorhizobium petrolearium TaxID=515361 RepID=UPI003F174648
MTHELHRRGHLVNHKRVARVMQTDGLGIKPRKRDVRTTNSTHDSPIYPNLYRNLIPAGCTPPVDRRNRLPLEIRAARWVPVLRSSPLVNEKERSTSDKASGGRHA